MFYTIKPTTRLKSAAIRRLRNADLDFRMYVSLEIVVEENFEYGVTYIICCQILKNSKSMLTNPFYALIFQDPTLASLVTKVSFSKTPRSRKRMRQCVMFWVSLFFKCQVSAFFVLLTRMSCFQTINAFSKQNCLFLKSFHNFPLP